MPKGGRTQHKPRKKDKSPEISGGGLPAFMADLFRNTVDPVSNLSLRALNPETRPALVKGAATGPFTLAPDMIGMAAGAMPQPHNVGGPPSQTAFNPDANQAFSGDPIRESVGLDPSDPLGMFGEMLDPSAAFLKVGKLAMAALKSGTTMSGALATVLPVAIKNKRALLQSVVDKDPRALAMAESMVTRESPMAHMEKVIHKLGHSFPNLPEARVVEDLNRSDFIYNIDVPVTGKNSNQVIDVARRFQHDALNAWGGKPMEVTPENIGRVADMWTDEALRAYELRPEMAGWYKHNLDEAFQSVARMHPEIATDQKAKDAYKMILAITSNGQKVTLNARLADDYYRLWKDSGKFPLLGSGKERNAMIESFDKANALFDDMGHQKAMQFLNRDFTVKELNEMGFKISDEKVDAIVKGSRIFGPKIGGGFMQNLFGNFNPATVDMWAKRTYGRYSGTLLTPEPLIINQRAALRKAIGRKEKFMKELGFDPTDVKENDATLDELAEALHKRFAKSKDPKTGSVYFNKNPINNAARQLDKSVNKVRDQVSGPEARVIRELMVQTRDRMRARGITNIDTADVQALLWYAEKDIYAKLGATTDVTRSDYAQAFRELADAR